MLTSTSRRPASAQRQALRAAEKLFRPASSAAREKAEGCPACGRRHPVAPVRSRHRAPLTIEHDWLCAACDHGWTTTAAAAAPSVAPGQSHRFAVGASVRMIVKYGSRPAPSELFEVLGLRPTEAGGVHYRIKSAAEAFERVVHEGDLRPAVPRDAAQWA